MTKKVLSGLTLALLIVGGSTVVSAAPVKDIYAGDTTVGYGYYDLDGSANGIYVEHGLTQKIIVGAEYLDLKHDQHILDIYGKYKLANNIFVDAGFRDYEDESFKFTVGVEAIAPISDIVDGYAAVKYNSFDTEFKVGLAHQLDSNWGIDVNYTWHDFDKGGNVNGLGIGVNYSF